MNGAADGAGREDPGTPWLYLLAGLTLLVRCCLSSELCRTRNGVSTDLCSGTTFSIDVFYDFQSYFPTLLSRLWATHCYVAIPLCFKCKVPSTAPARSNNRGVNKMNCRPWKQESLKKSSLESRKMIGAWRPAVLRAAPQTPLC